MVAKLCSPATIASGRATTIAQATPQGSQKRPLVANNFRAKKTDIRRGKNLAFSRGSRYSLIESLGDGGPVPTPSPSNFLLFPLQLFPPCILSLVAPAISLTVQWLPSVKAQEGKDYATHKLILGTHTSGSEQNYLMVANVNLPVAGAEIDNRTYDDEKGEMGGFGGVHGKVRLFPSVFVRVGAFSIFCRSLF